MPLALKFFSVEEVCDELGLKKETERKSLAQYISRNKLGQKFGSARALTEADIDKCRNRREGRPPKESQA